MGTNDNNNKSLRSFVNPYNFVPFGDKVESKRVSRESVYRGDEELLSGWLTVQLDTKTPIIIPDGAHVKYIDPNTGKRVNNLSGEAKRKLHKEYDFLKLPRENGSGREYAIPGSELRGLIRSVYEAVTDSCVPFLLDDKPISQRVPIYGSLHRRGLLGYDARTDCWSLYSAISQREKGTITRQTTGRAKFNGVTLKAAGTYNKSKGGWLQYNIPVNLKKEYNIAYLKADKSLYTWKAGDDEPYKMLKSALYRDGAEKPKGNNPNEFPNKDIRDALERAKNAEKDPSGEVQMVPVYYFGVERDGQKMYYISNSAIGRLAQRRKWVDIMGDHAPCKDTDRLCPACSLFGTTNGKGMKGHLSVTDAMPNGGEIKTKRHTLGILGGPRTSAFEFYLRRPIKDAVYWNFDFYGEKVDKNDDRSPVEYKDLAKATPRGRKMYWHSTPNPDPVDKTKMNQMNTTMEAAEGSFRFRVYFNQITRSQLDDIEWVIALGDNRSDSKYQHKLGHAKPYGYGSVKLTIKEENVRTVKYENGRITQEVITRNGDNLDMTPHFNRESDAVKDLLIITDCTSVPNGIPVEYPAAENKGERMIFSWFANNRNNYKNLRVLPEPDAKKITMVENVKGSSKNGSNGSKSNTNSRKHAKSKGNNTSYTDKMEHGNSAFDNIKIKIEN